MWWLREIGAVSGMCFHVVFSFGRLLITEAKLRPGPSRLPGELTDAGRELTDGECGIGNAEFVIPAKRGNRMRNL
jgi:hypothetical protein